MVPCSDRNREVPVRRVICGHFALDCKCGQFFRNFTMQRWSNYSLRLDCLGYSGPAPILAASIGNTEEHRPALLSRRRSFFFFPFFMYSAAAPQKLKVEFLVHLTVDYRTVPGTLSLRYCASTGLNSSNPQGPVTAEGCGYEFRQMRSV